MNSVELVLTTVVISIIIMINLLIYGAKSRADKILADFKQELAKTGEKVALRTSNANFFGLKSLGGGQIRGNGVLALTDKRVYFCRYYPKKEISIPLEAIKSVEITQSYLGKNIYTPLLKINYENDEVAFALEDASEWAEKLRPAA